MRHAHYIIGSGNLPTPIHTMPDTRERWQQQACKDTAEAKDIPGAVVSSGSHLLVGWHLELQLPPTALLTWPLAMRKAAWVSGGKSLGNHLPRPSCSSMALPWFAISNKLAALCSETTHPWDLVASWNTASSSPFLTSSSKYATAFKQLQPLTHTPLLHSLHTARSSPWQMAHLASFPSSFST